MNTFDPNPYRKSLNEMTYMFRQGTPLNEISAVSHVPLMAVLMYAKQVLRMPVREEDLELCRAFYQYGFIKDFTEEMPAHARR